MSQVLWMQLTHMQTRSETNERTHTHACIHTYTHTPCAKGKLSGEEIERERESKNWWWRSGGRETEGPDAWRKLLVQLLVARGWLLWRMNQSSAGYSMITGSFEVVWQCSRDLKHHEIIWLHINCINGMLPRLRLYGLKPGGRVGYTCVWWKRRTLIGVLRCHFIKGLLTIWPLI